MKKSMKLVLALLLAAMIVPAGIAAYAAIGDGGKSDSQPSEIYESTEDVIIPQEVLDLIEEADPASFARHVSNYKQALVAYRVPLKLQQAIENRIRDGYRLPDIMIGYAFLYPRFGTVEHLNAMLDRRSNGDSWTAIFTDFNREQPAFSPRNFESEQLEQLMNTPSLSADDIMIADRLSFVTGKSIDDILLQKQSIPHWYPVTSDAGVLFTADELPRVQMTSEQLQKFMKETGWTEDRVTAAFVTADQLGQEPDAVIGKLKAGDSEEAIAAAVYEAKYQ